MDLRYREERRTETRDIHKTVVCLVHCYMPILRPARVRSIYAQQLVALVSRVMLGEASDAVVSGISSD